MSKYLVTHSDGGGVQESTFDTYNDALYYMTGLPESTSGVSFTTLHDPDDAREEQWYDEQ